jgi:exonuclease SbcC
LAKFLDLDMFEKKFKMAKEDAYSLKSILKRYENKNFKQDILDAQAEVKTAEGRIADSQESLEELKSQHSAIQSRLDELAWIPDVTEKELQAFQARKIELDTLRSTLEQLETEKRQYNSKDIDEYNDLRVKMGKVRSMMEGALKQEERIKGQMKILDEIPCENKFPQCRFIKDVSDSKSRLEEVLREKEKIKENHIVIAERMAALEPIVNRLRRINDDISEVSPQIERTAKKLGLVYDEIKKYEQSKNKVENLNELLEERKTLDKTSSQLELKINGIEDNLFRLHKTHGSAQQKWQTAVDKSNEIEDYRKEYDAYELFLRCTHSGGISFEIIKNKLPIINKAIDSILVNVVNFRVFFENNENRLDIFIQHPKYEKRPLELGSGAEKALAAVAIRMAFIMTSTLSSTNLVVLDEPAVELDESHIEGFIQILQVLKEKFDTIIVISHLEVLKEAIETHITIETSGKYAHIVQ